MQTRKATVEDAALIAAHRRAMFEDMGGRDATTLAEMERNCVPWIARMIGEGRYMGWIVSDGARDVASAGLLLLDWPPHPLDPAGTVRGYVLNVFVDGEYRRRGLARALVTECMAEARRRGIRVVTLHASEAGKQLYETLGFRGTNEMMIAEGTKVSARH